MQHCKELELVRLSVNRLHELPRWLLELPKLSWIAFSGNRFSDSVDSSTLSTASGSTSRREFSWNQFKKIEKIGEGASGEVFKVESDYYTDRDQSCFAVKVYKGAITSDGLAEDEIRINEMVGQHQNFVPVLGRVLDHPFKKLAIVLPLLKEGEFKVLGGPPSFESITRDTFPEKTLFKKEFIHNVIKGVAEALRHLHRTGIIHGDVYAHNIMVNEEGFPLLTDFGAASFKSNLIGADGLDILESIEVRAFGCLVDDLLSRYVDSGEDSNSFGILHNLRQRCLSAVKSERPKFSEIVRLMQDL